PLPDRPIIATVSPSSILNETSCQTRFSPKLFVRFCISIIGLSNITWIIHKEIWFWARRNGNGGGEVLSYLEHAIFHSNAAQEQISQLSFIAYKKKAHHLLKHSITIG